MGGDYKNCDFVFTMVDLEAKLEVVKPFFELKDDEKKELGKNNEA